MNACELRLPARRRVHALSSPRRAFTLIELLVVIAIIALLAALIFGATRRSREAAYRVKCLQNVRQLTSALLLYAGDNGGSFPLGGGYWPWDLPVPATDAMIRRYGITRSQFYCPAYPEKNTDTYWRFSSAYRVTAYVWMLRGTPQVPPNKQLAGLSDGNSVSASKSELVVDAVLSEGGVYTNVAGGAVLNRSNHMNAKTDKPEGGNIGYKDGHAEWRPFYGINPVNGRDEELMVTKFGTPQFQF